MGPDGSGSCTKFRALPSVRIACDGGAEGRSHLGRCKPWGGFAMASREQEVPTRPSDSSPIKRSSVVVATGVELEWCNCGSLMSTEIDGEELLCGSCDADDGYDGRADVTQMDGDIFESAHGG